MCLAERVVFMPRALSCWTFAGKSSHFIPVLILNRFLALLFFFTFEAVGLECVLGNLGLINGQWGV